MMAVSSKYEKINIPSIGEDEPVFILRAQDRLATAAVEMYGALSNSHNAPVVKTLQEEIENFRNHGG
jgi:hypothetical protein